MKNLINEKIICAGFGGQGIMVMGKVLAEAGMMKGLNVTWLPSYGAEVRGGTAHSSVSISSEAISSPIVSLADTVIIMNAPSLDKFEGRVKKRGLLIVNTSMVTRPVKRKDVDLLEYPFTEEAIKIGNVRVANMIVVGLFATKKNIFDKETIIKVMRKMARGREEILPANIKAVERGFEIATSLEMVKK